MYTTTRDVVENLANWVFNIMMSSAPLARHLAAEVQLLVCSDEHGHHPRIFQLASSLHCFTSYFYKIDPLTEGGRVKYVDQQIIGGGYRDTSM